jgi:hypothetical protein
VNNVGVHGPYVSYSYHHGVTDGLLSLRRPDHFGQLVYHHGTFYGPYVYDITEHAHGDGARYLLCARSRDRSAPKDVFGPRGHLGTFLLELNDPTCITAKYSSGSETGIAVILRGGIVARHEGADRLNAYVTGRDVLQVVHWDDGKDERRTSIYCNGSAVGGPYLAVDEFAFDGTRGVFTFTAYRRDHDGVERCESVMGSYRE